MAIGLVKQYFRFIAPCQLFLMVLSFLLPVVCQVPRNWSEADWSVVVWIFLLAPPEDRSDIYCLPVTRNPPDHYDLPKIIRNCLSITSASSLSICGSIIVSGSTDLCMSIFVKCSLTWFPSKVILPWSIISHWPQAFQKASLTYKPWSKGGSEYFGLFCPLSLGALPRSAEDLHFPSSCFCCWVACMEAVTTELVCKCAEQFSPNSPAF